MKNLFLLLSLIGLLVFSCSKDECTQDCYLQEVYNPALKANVSRDALNQTFCHNGNTITPGDPSDHGSTHIDGTPCYVGACGTLGIEDYNVFGPITAWQIPCEYSEETIFIDNKEYYITY